MLEDDDGQYGMYYGMRKSGMSKTWILLSFAKTDRLVAAV
jgi:hypothetical protein